jgi:hypothetical protein
MNETIIFFTDFVQTEIPQVHYFSEDIQQTQDRISLSLKVVGGVTVDIHSGKKSKSRVDAITMSIDNIDYDLQFELTDEFPGIKSARK